MRLWISLLAFSAALHAQVVGTLQPAGQNPGAARAAAAPTPPEDLCTIQGQVFNSVTGEPLKKATLNLQRSDMAPDMMSMPPTYSTSTDASGKFAMKDIEPGRYSLSVNRNGYVTTSYGSRGPNRPGTTLALSRGQNLKDVDFRLTPHGVITGRVVDEDGEPVPYVRVQLLTYRYQQGRKQLGYAGGGNTDDLGDYRIFGVAPGKYFVSAMANNQASMYAQDRSAAALPDEDYVPTYYPGTTDVSTAAQLEVTPGGQVRDVMMRLSKTHTVRVKGHVSYSVPGHPRVNVYLLPRTQGMGGPMPVRPSQIDPKGDFDIRGVAPGSYSLTAVINDGTKSYQTRVPLEVGASNIERANLAIGPGIEVRGTVRVEGNEAQPADLSNLRLMLQPRELGGIMFGGVAPGKLDEGRGFKIQDVSPGLFNLMVMGLPAGFYVKSVRSDQTDVLTTGLNTEAAQAPLEVLLSGSAAQVSGSVQNAATNTPMAGATVVLVPQEKERKDQANYYKQINSDQNGAFTFKDVVPGEYKVYAWEDVEAGAYMDAEYMKPFESKGEPLSVGENDRRSLQLTVIPADAPAGKDKG
jgi:protocatechuate 3,4-dioxygenase beta subunit